MIYTDKFYMSSDEIINMYKYSADKFYQLSILSQLNACSIIDIKEFLHSMGLLSEKDFKKPSSRRPKIKIDFETLKVLFNRDMSCKEMAEIFGVSSSTIHNRLREYGIIP